MTTPTSPEPMHEPHAFQNTEDLIEHLRNIGFRIIPTHGLGDYHEWTHTVQWDLPYDQMSAVTDKAVIDFDARFPADFKDKSVMMDSTSDSMYVKDVSEYTHDQLIHMIASWVSGQYWADSLPSFHFPREADDDI